MEKAPNNNHNSADTGSAYEDWKKVSAGKHVSTESLEEARKAAQAEAQQDENFRRQGHETEDEYRDRVREQLKEAYPDNDVDKMTDAMIAADKKLYEDSKFGHKEQAIEQAFDKRIEAIEKNVAAGNISAKDAKEQEEAALKAADTKIAGLRQDYADSQVVATPEDEAHNREVYAKMAEKEHQVDDVEALQKQISELQAQMKVLQDSVKEMQAQLAGAEAAPAAQAAPDISSQKTEKIEKPEAEKAEKVEAEHPTDFANELAGNSDADVQKRAELVKEWQGDGDVDALKAKLGQEIADLEAQKETDKDHADEIDAKIRAKENQLAIIGRNMFADEVKPQASEIPDTPAEPEVAIDDQVQVPEGIAKDDFAIMITPLDYFNKEQLDKKYKTIFDKSNNNLKVRQAILAAAYGDGVIAGSNRKLSQSFINWVKTGNR